MYLSYRLSGFWVFTSWISSGLTLVSGCSLMATTPNSLLNSLKAHQLTSSGGCNHWWLWHPLLADVAGNIPLMTQTSTILIALWSLSRIQPHLSPQLLPLRFKPASPGPWQQPPGQSPRCCPSPIDSFHPVKDFRIQKLLSTSCFTQAPETVLRMAIGSFSQVPTPPWALSLSFHPQSLLLTLVQPRWPLAMSWTSQEHPQRFRLLYLFFAPTF